MVRGRKKQEIHKISKVISFRISVEQYNIINKNKFLKKEMKEKILELLEHYKQV